MGGRPKFATPSASAESTPIALRSPHRAVEALQLPAGLVHAAREAGGLVVGGWARTAWTPWLLLRYDRVWGCDGGARLRAGASWGGDGAAIVTPCVELWFHRLWCRAITSPWASKARAPRLHSAGSSGAGGAAGAGVAGGRRAHVCRLGRPRQAQGGAPPQGRQGGERRVVVLVAARPADGVRAALALAHHLSFCSCSRAHKRGCETIGLCRERRSMWTSRWKIRASWRLTHSEEGVGGRRGARLALRPPTRSRAHVRAGLPTTWSWTTSSCPCTPTSTTSRAWQS